MLWRVKKELSYWRAHGAFARILATPPAESRDDGAIIFSQLQGKDVLLYLMAAKSFAHHTGFGRFTVLDDGTLTASHRALLARHLPGIEFRTMKDVRRGDLPAGNTWERLIAIVELATTNYVIQLDADTLTFSHLDEVRRCVARSRSFTIMAGHTARMLPLAESSAVARQSTMRHIQIAAERRLGELDPSIGARYVCGSSAFAGFRPDPTRRAALERFSTPMEELLGLRWREWGTEQVSSNFLVASDAGVMLLPYGRYRNFIGEPLGADCVFAHFFASYRFLNGTYRRAAIATSPGRACATSRPRASPTGTG